jgi:hypothetical protein
VARTRKKLNVKPEEILEAPAQKDAPGEAPVEKNKGISDEKFKSLVSLMATDSRNYIQEEVAVLRARATEYYKGRLPDVDKDDAEEDRSQVVTTDVRDTTLGMMPDLMRIFTVDHPVEYEAIPEGEADQFALREAQAKQATEYVKNVVLRIDNPNYYMTLWSTFQDALVRKTGVITWFWEKLKTPTYSTHTGLTEQEAVELVSDPEITVVSKTTNENGTLDLQLRRVCTYGKARIQGIPVENFLVNRGAYDVGSAQLVGYVEEKTVGDFVAEGFDADDLKDCDEDPDDNESVEGQARQPHRGSTVKSIEPPEDPAQRKVHYGKLYILADRDGDGIPELNRVITAGTKYKVLKSEPVDEAPFATFCPYPEGYSFFGDSAADLTMDIMRIKSRILRDVMDSLAQSVIPQTSVLEGAVNLDDVLNPDTSRVIRTRQIGAVQPHVIPFVGKEALPVLELLDNTREQRTGISDASAGLDPKALQSTDKDAVQATLTRAQSRIELVARNFAETGMRRLFSGLLRLIIRNQDAQRLATIGGQVVPINPKDWQENMHVNVTPPKGPVAEQISFLIQVAAKQEEILEKLGFQNPLVTIVQYRNTLAKVIELAGQNPASFFLDPSKMDPQALQQMLQQMEQAKAAQNAPPQTGPDPKIEMAKIQARQQEHAATIQKDLQIAAMREKAQFQLEAMRLYANSHTQLSLEEMRNAAKAASDHIDAATAVVVQKLKEHHEDGRHIKTLEAQPKEPANAGD